MPSSATPRRHVVFARRFAVLLVFPLLAFGSASAMAAETIRDCYRDFLLRAWKDAATDPEDRPDAE